MKRSVLILATLTALFIAAPMFAATATGSIAVGGSVSQVCSMTVPANLTFDPYDVFSATDNTKTADINVKCTKGASVRLDLNAGVNGGNKMATSSTRSMQVGATGVYLDYDLFDGATLWGAGAGTGGKTLTDPGKSGTNYTVTGKIFAGQDATVGGGYADTITATLNY